MLIEEFTWKKLYSISKGRSSTKLIDIALERTLKIYNNLTIDQHQQLIKFLQKNSSTFVWNYLDMKGIHPDICQHHIYIKYGVLPIKK